MTMLYIRSVDRPDTLDLRERWLDVRRIARSRPEYKACIRAGWEDEDLWPEVYVRALARQDMASRYNPERACVSKYLSVLTSSILRNLLDAAQRRAKREAQTMQGGACDGGGRNKGGDGKGAWW